MVKAFYQQFPKSAKRFWHSLTSSLRPVVWVKKIPPDRGFLAFFTTLHIFIQLSPTSTKLIQVMPY